MRKPTAEEHASVKTANKRVEKLLKAVEPFADIGQAMPDRDDAQSVEVSISWPNEEGSEFDTLTLFDFRRAVEAHKEATEEGA